MSCQVLWLTSKQTVRPWYSGALVLWKLLPSDLRPLHFRSRAPSQHPAAAAAGIALPSIDNETIYLICTICEIDEGLLYDRTICQCEAHCAYGRHGPKALRFMRGVHSDVQDADAGPNH